MSSSESSFTLAQKRKLAEDILQLPPAMLHIVVQVVQQNEGASMQHRADMTDFDLATLSDETLRKVQECVRFYSAISSDGPASGASGDGAGAGAGSGGSSAGVGASESGESGGATGRSGEEDAAAPPAKRTRSTRSSSTAVSAPLCGADKVAYPSASEIAARLSGGISDGAMAPPPVPMFHPLLRTSSSGNNLGSFIFNDETEPVSMGPPPPPPPPPPQDFPTFYPMESTDALTSIEGIPYDVLARREVVPGSSVDIVASAVWVCPLCTLENDEAVALCTLCGSKKPPRGTVTRPSPAEKQNAFKVKVEVYNSQHTNPRGNFACDRCDRVFRSRSDLVAHIRTHTGEKPLKCRYCEKCFAHSSNRSAHERSHRNEKRYVCEWKDADSGEVCGKRFAHSSSLRDHTYKHQGIRPYKCDFPKCGATFTAVANLSRHKKLHFRDGTARSLAKRGKGTRGGGKAAKTDGARGGSGSGAGAGGAAASTAKAAKRRRR